MKIALPYTIRKRPDTGTWQVSINPTSGVSVEICEQWRRKSFENFPDELSEYRHPKSETKARQGAQALITYLLKSPETIAAIKSLPPKGQTVGEWVALFLDIATSPRAARLIAKNQPYSPDTIELYNDVYRSHLSDDPILDEPIATITASDVLAYLGRLSTHRVKEGRRRVGEKIVGPESTRMVGGTRTFEIVFKFLRMTFNEYGRHHPDWPDPFRGIDTPKPIDTGAREGLEEAEIARLFAPGVLNTPMEKAVAAAMFWAGLRRSEIFALRPQDLDWQGGRIFVEQAWKQFDNLKKRTIGTTKGRRARVTLFPDVLQTAVTALWEANGRHPYVFSFKDGTLPNARWFSYHVGVWFTMAGIDLRGRKITPHSARHSLASILEAQGTPLRYIQELLGHSDLKTTLGYLHTPSNIINRITHGINNAAGGEKDGKDEK